MPRTLQKLSQPGELQRRVEQPDENTRITTTEDEDIKVTTVTRSAPLPPQVSDFFLVKLPKPMSAEKFFEVLNADVLGNYDQVNIIDRDAGFGMIVFEYGDLILCKMDAGPWKWYADASAAFAYGLMAARPLGAAIMV